MFANKLEPQDLNAEMLNSKCIYFKRRISYGFIVIVLLLFNSFDDVTEAAVLPSSLEYEEFDKIPAEMYDLDTKQSEARYDPRTLLKEFLSRMEQTNGNSYTYGDLAKFDTSTTIDDGELYAEERRNSGGAHCTDGNERYEHGEKIQRSDPCEMCLCIDGEIFCWWQKCSGKRQKHTKKRPHPDLRHKWNHLGDESYHEHNRIHSKTSDNNQSQNKYKEHSISTAGATAAEEESPAHAYHTKETTQSNVLLLQQKHEQRPDKLQQQEQMKNKFSKISSFAASASASASAIGKHKHSLHIMDMNVSEMDSDDKDVKIDGSTSFYRKIHNIDKSIDEPTTSVKSQILTPTIMDAHQQLKNKQHNELIDTVNSVAIPDNVAPLLSSQALPLPNVLTVHANVTNGLLENGVVLNNRVTSIAVIDRNGNDEMLARHPFNGHMNNTINIINKINNNDSTVNPVILAGVDKQFGMQTSHFSDVNTQNIHKYIDDTDGMDKGFYEKTIVNKNGVFIENIRKISGLDQRLFDVIDNADDDDDNDDDDDTVQQINQKNNFDKIDKMDDTMNATKSTLASDASAQASSLINDEHTNNEQDEFNRKRIDLMNNGAIVQHYVITSSGKIEKTDTLNSDEVQTQMQGVNQYRSSINSNSNSNSNNNNINRPYQLAQTDDEMVTITATISTPKSTLTAANNVDNFPGGSFLTTINSAVPMSVTTSSLADQSNSNCIVMGKSYKIGTILPQEPGNCLQCLCVKGANEGDAPRVTCSPHNCPPLILPDLFDSTGY